ncbi:O-antigen ligase family protein [Arcicella aquatica]|uniref:O-antigen ligase family protein n=1 Tax=Arcicella aquatica TaxID=217141 RepID=A0ABU5QS62_9BACT|nr:O-antigen ligase family protein [Arcicella aquatica]MEA5259585.1 O-antigen ligase family protein [Arcicella aquatica]
MNVYSTTPMESNLFTKRWSFVNSSLLCCVLITLLCWSVFIERTDIYDGKVLSKCLYFNKVASFTGFVLGIIYLLRRRVVYVGLSLTSYFIIAYLSYLCIHVLYFDTYLDVRIGSQFLLLLISLVISIERPKETYIIIVIWFFACVEAIWGLYQLYQHFYDWKHFDNPLGSLYNTGIYGIYLCIPFVLAVVSSKKYVATSACSKHYLFHTIRYITLILTGTVLPFTGSRTAWVATLGGLFVFVCHRYRLIQLFQQNKIWIKGLVSFLLIGIVSLFILQLFFLKENSAIGRTLIWKVGFTMWLDNPFWGKGFNSVSHQYFNYQAHYFSVDRSAQEQWIAGNVSYVFNDFLQIAIEYGSIGLILFVGIYTTIIRKNTSPYVAVLVSCLLTGQSSYPLESIPTQLHWYLILSLCLLRVVPLKSILLSKWTMSILGVAIFSLSLILWLKTSQSDETERASYKAEQLFNQEQYKMAILVYEKIPNLNAVNLLVYGKSLALDGQHSKAIRVYEQAKVLLAEPFLCNNLGLSYQAIKKFKKAEENYRLSHNMIPNLIYPKYLLANLYIEKGDVKKAKEQAIEVVDSPVKVYSEAAEEMKEEMRDFIRTIALK